MIYLSASILKNKQQTVHDVGAVFLHTHWGIIVLTSMTLYYKKLFKNIGSTSMYHYNFTDFVDGPATP